MSQDQDRQRGRVGTVAGRVVRYSVMLLVAFLAELGCLGTVALCAADDRLYRVGGGLIAAASAVLCLLVVWCGLPARWPRRPWYP
jgi:hypothetical protein